MTYEPLTYHLMAGFLQSALRNFLIITVAVIALAVLFSRSNQARTMLAPPGAELPPGVQLNEDAPK